MIAQEASTHTRDSNPGNGPGGERRDAPETRALPETASWLRQRENSTVELTEALEPYRDIVFTAYDQVKADLGLERYCRLGTALTGMKHCCIQLVSGSDIWCVQFTGFGKSSEDDAAAGGRTDADVVGHYVKEDVVCQDTVKLSSGEWLEVPDLLVDDRYKDLAAVKPGYFKSYLGVPLTTIDGRVIGTFCSLDDKTRPQGWSQSETDGLRDLAALIRNELDLRVDRLLAAKAKQVFLSQVNHEMKTPIHGLVASTELLASEDTEGYSRFTPFQKQCISNIQACSSNLIDVINNVLSFTAMTEGAPEGLDGEIEKSAAPASTSSSATAGKLELPGQSSSTSFTHHNVDICQLVEDVLDSCWAGRRQCRNSEQNAIRAVVSIAPDLLTNHLYHLNKGEISRIIMNIFGNGCKYTDVGYVQVSVFADPMARVEGRQSVCMVVQDTGRGIPAEFIASGALFRPFQQGDSSAEGVGLGMSIVKHLLEHSGGSLDVNSMEGLGTTVTMRFELARSTKRPRQIPSYHDRTYYMNPVSKTKGEAKMVDAIAMALERWYGLRAVQDPASADLAVLRTVEELEALRSQSIDVPCIFVTDGASTWKQLDHHQNVHIAQIPVGPKKVGKLLERVLGRRTSIGRENSDGSSTNLNADADLTMTDDGARSSDSLPSGLDPAEARSGSSTPSNAPAKRSIPRTFSPAQPKRELRLHGNHIDSDSNAQQHDAHEMHSSQQQRKPHVLCCEDNDVNLRVLTTIVERLGLTYDVAKDGLEAAQKYEAALVESPFDVVFMDLGLPTLSGFEACARMRQAEAYANLAARGRGPARVIALTGGHGPDDVARCRQAGIDDYVVKPVPVKVLRKMLETWTPREPVPISPQQEQHNHQAASTTAGLTAHNHEQNRSQPSPPREFIRSRSPLVGEYMSLHHGRTPSTATSITRDPRSSISAASSPIGLSLPLADAAGRHSISSVLSLSNYPPEVLTTPGLETPPAISTETSGADSMDEPCTGIPRDSRSATTSTSTTNSSSAVSPYSQHHHGYFSAATSPHHPPLQSQAHRA
ncbi:hypothetical protein PYCC9005_005051 [Savitreella phatthalungensis]